MPRSSFLAQRKLTVRVVTILTRTAATYVTGSLGLVR